MKKVLMIISAVMLICVGCSKDDTPQKKQTATYSIFCTYLMSVDLQARLSYDAHLSDRLYFYEYDGKNNKIDYKIWEKPVLNRENTFVANEKAEKVVVYYELTGKKIDGGTLAEAYYIKEVIPLVKGQKAVITLTATTIMTSSNPIK